ncbi:MAG: hypothetical protein CMJ23_13130 [Phycisphaerae bacterium]|nr:hypothetical protein [Phycisphaerae bacterium]
MTDWNSVSRNCFGLDSGTSIFRGLNLRRAFRWLPIGVLTFSPIFSGCGEEASKKDAALQGQAPRRISGVQPLDEAADDVFLATSNTAPEQVAASDGRWSLLLMTVGGDSHPIQAMATRNQIASRYPSLRAAFVRPQGKGSAIWFGRFSSPSDPAAVAARETVRDLVEEGRRVFPQSFLSILPDDSPIGERDLRNLRLMYPGVNPLYSLQVACWGTFGTDEISYEEVTRRAEAYTAELRNAGHDAWYYHDPLTELSVITIGVFDKRAYDGRSTLFSPEVEMLMRAFPIHRINGEEVMVEITQGDRSTRVPQGCRLVTVPELP